MNENIEFDPARSAAIRGLLVAAAARDRRPARRRLRAGLVIGAVVFGSLASVGAAAVIASTSGWIALPRPSARQAASRATPPSPTGRSMPTDRPTACWATARFRPT